MQTFRFHSLLLKLRLFGTENHNYALQNPLLALKISHCLVFQLTGPYLYKLYSHYGFEEAQIAVLYVCGFSSTVILGTWAPIAADRYEHIMVISQFDRKHYVWLRIISSLTAKILTTRVVNIFFFHFVDMKLC